MDLNTIVVIGAVLLIVIIYFTIRNRKDASKMMENNTNVAPLMLVRSTQIKVNRLQQATQDNTQANAQLVKLAAAYKNNQLSIQDYNQKLDKMIFSLNIDL